VRIAGFGFAGIAMLLAVVILAGRGDPCVEEVPAWIDDAVAVGFIAALGAILCGVAVLFQRRWVSAILMMGPGPFAILIAGLSTTCWN
jgi:hypothetical protein